MFFYKIKRVLRTIPLLQSICSNFLTLLVFSFRKLNVLRLGLNLHFCYVWSEFIESYIFLRFYFTSKIRSFTLQNYLSFGINFLSSLKTLPFRYKIIIILFLNLFFLVFSSTTILLLYFSLFTIDLFFILVFLRPIFFLFSSYFLTSFFAPCFIDLYNLKPTLHSGLFILCLLLLLVTFFHKSLKIRLLSSFTSFGIRLFVMGDITMAGGGFKLSNLNSSPDTSIMKASPLGFNKNPFFNQLGQHQQMLAISSELPILHKTFEFIPKHFKKDMLQIYSLEPYTPSINDQLQYLKISGFTGNLFTNFTDIAEKLDISKLESDFYEDNFGNKLYENNPTSDSTTLAVYDHLSIAQFHREFLSAKAFVLKTFPNQDFTLRRGGAGTDFIAFFSDGTQFKFDITNINTRKYLDFEQKIKQKYEKLPSSTKIVLGDFTQEYAKLVEQLPEYLQRRVAFVESRDFQNVLIQNNIDHDFLQPFEYKREGFFTLNELGKYTIPIKQGLDILYKL